MSSISSTGTDARKIIPIHHLKVNIGKPRIPYSGTVIFHVYPIDKQLTFAIIKPWTANLFKGGYARNEKLF